VPHCRRQIFAERFGEDVVPLRRRRTARLEHIVHHLGLALGGRPAASFAKTNRKVQRNFWRAGTLLIGARFVLHQRLGIAEFSSMATQIVMDSSGDSRHFFDQDDPKGLAEAERRFKMFTGQGFTAATRTAAGDLKLIRSFEPTAEETLFYPHLVGG
jgi:hypothetical protein